MFKTPSAKLVKSESVDLKDMYFKSACKYYFGLETQVNYPLAMHDFAKSADLGHSKAQLYLGWISLKAVGVNQDITRAIHYLELAANQGCADAQVNLGIMYFQGEELSQDAKKANSYFQEAAKSEHAIAQFYLGRMSELGYVVKKDLDQAKMYYIKSYMHGYEPAMDCLNRINGAKKMAESRSLFKMG